MVGAIVGVGVFGLPYVFAQTGFATTLIELLVLGVLLTILQLMQAEVVIQTGGHNRLAGYVRKYLGSGWAWVALISLAAGVWGAMLAYIIVGGNFLYLLVSPIMGGTEFVYSVLIAVVASALIYRGLRFASRFEGLIVGILLFLFIFIALASVPHIQWSSFSITGTASIFLPYGVILFALSGIGIVPEIRDVLGERLKNRIGYVIISGMAVILLLYALFSAAVVGVTGPATTPVAFDGLIPMLGKTFGIVATLLGSLTIISIYLMLGIELLNTLRFDFRVHHKMAWAIVTIVPLVFYLAGARAFIQVIGFVGSIFSGALGILIALTYAKMKNSPLCKRRECLNFPNVLTWLLIALFVGGMIYQVMTL